ncbi:outer membrane beta-barrel protein [Gelidibacter sp. F63206]|uniref:outer membrane beta-barrel protein n=1 Tax=Gelidibacter sp. F63206 TaxID=2926425 RepID=UPI00293E2384|nr:outer membrane beta-barrel protein [Gelidibacter sp. F63206]
MSSAFDLGYQKRWSKPTFKTSVYNQYETDAFERIQEDTGNETANGIPIISMLPINLSTNKRIGFEAGFLYRYNPVKWLRLNGSFNFFLFTTEDEFNGVDYSAKNTISLPEAAPRCRCLTRLIGKPTLFTVPFQ